MRLTRDLIFIFLRHGVFLHSPGTHYIDLADLEITRIHPPLPPSAGTKSLCHHALKFRNLKIRKTWVCFVLFLDSNMESFNHDPRRALGDRVVCEHREAMA